VTTHYKTTIVLRGFVILLILICSRLHTLGQDAAGSTRVDYFAVSTVEALSNGSQHYVWQYWLDDVSNMSYSTRACFEWNANGTIGGGVFLNDILIGSGGRIPVQYIADPFNYNAGFGFQAWRTTNSDYCVLHLFNTTFWCNVGAYLRSFNYMNYPPGILNQEDFSNLCSDFNLHYHFTRTINKPAITYAPFPSGIICDADPTYTLGANTYLGTYDLNYGQFETIWEYSVGSPNAWQPLFQPPNEISVFNITTPSFHLRSLNGLASITDITSVYFRMKTVMHVTNSPFSPGDVGRTFQSPSSEYISIQLAPAPPTINSTIPSLHCLLLIK